MVGLGEAFGEGEPDSAEDDGADGLDEQVGEHGCPFAFLELLDEVEREGGERGVAAEESDAEEESEGWSFAQIPAMTPRARLPERLMIRVARGNLVLWRARLMR